MKNIAIIPARGGSKRIPRKNIKDFYGKPIIAYSIEAALKSELFEEVVVSTEDTEIADLSIKYGAKVPFMRSVKNANDYATTVDVLLEVFEQYSNLKQSFDCACCIYPTAPMVSSEKIKRGFEKLVFENRTSVFSAVAFEYPIWRGIRESENGKFSMIWPENVKVRTQDFENVYHDAGQWYWVNISDFKTKQSLFSDNSSVIILSQVEVQDIDTLSDWKLAELKYEILQKSE
ncbi:MAG: pseudaminic acid cytidylyltransferase [Bacteroidales bacterium]